MTTTNITKFLLVEDSPAQALRFKVSLENIGCHVHWTSNGNDGLAAAHLTDFNLY